MKLFNLMRKRVKKSRSADIQQEVMSRINKNYKNGSQINTNGRRPNEQSVHEPGSASSARCRRSKVVGPPVPVYRRPLVSTGGAAPSGGQRPACDAFPVTREQEVEARLGGPTGLFWVRRVRFSTWTSCGP